MSVSLHGDLEIGLRRVLRDAYEVTLRLLNPASEAEVAPVSGPAAIDPKILLPLQNDPAAYGRALADQVFADPGVRALYAKARAVLAADDAALRVRLAVDPSALELHDLRWELLHDPESATSIATSERLLFSRFMRSGDWRRVRQAPRDRLRAVVAVAAPTDLDAYGLAAIDVAGEVTRAREALADIAVTVLGEQAPLTLDLLVAALRNDPDIVYLVCHGALDRRGPWLFLQTPDGKTARVPGAELARRIADLPRPPRLIFLASCESAAATTSTPDAALAPLLADAGVPAIVAMQGKVSMATIKIAAPRFFRELLIDGQIDRAMAVARGAVRTSPDHWMPALYLRLRTGRLWYEPGLGGAYLGDWTGLCQKVQAGAFVPILGPDLDDRLFGGTRDLARSLAANFHFPGAEHERDDLAKVAQYIHIMKGRAAACDAVADALTAGMHASHPDLVAAAPDDAAAYRAIVTRHCDDERDPLHALARLPASLYINAGLHRHLLAALDAAGKAPEELFRYWRTEYIRSGDGLQASPPPPEDPADSARKPTPQQPLVYHVFGTFAEPRSLVLTEDEYLDYVIEATQNALIPVVVRGSLPVNALLFLGFRFDDWRFRVLFRLIACLPGLSKNRQFRHVGVQLNPDEHSLADVDAARRYLDRYFSSDRGRGDVEPELLVYWGSPADFLHELHRRLAELPPPATRPVKRERIVGYH